MEKNLKSVVTRLQLPINNSEHQLIKPVCRLVSAVKRLDNASNANENIFMEDNSLSAKEVLKKEFKPIKYRDLYKDTIFFDYSKSLQREDRRLKLSDDVYHIIQNKTVMIETKNGYISDFMFGECHKWFQVKNPFVFIESGTGTGKTSFIESYIAYFHLKALIITNRSIAKEQMKNRLEIVEYTDCISVTSYQAIEGNRLITPEFLDTFDVIVLDEVHYFKSDALMNNQVNISYKKILSTQKAIKIGLSATIDDIRFKIIGDLLIDNDDYLITKERIFNYYMRNNASKIRSICSFSDFESLVPLMVQGKDKWLIFVDSIKQGYSFLEKLFENNFSENELVFLNRKDLENGKNKELLRKVYKEISDKNKFSCKILITTKIIDNAVNIVDKSLKNIVIMEDDKTTFLQMLGRKRCVNENDDFDLFIFTGDRTKLIRRKNGNLRLKNFMEKVGESVEKTPLIKLEISKNGDGNDEYRDCVSVNVARNRYELNTLGYVKVQCDIRDQEELVNTDIFDTKVAWVLASINYTPRVFDSRSRTFIDEMSDYIDSSINKGDKQAKININELFKRYYGVEGSDDNYASISLKRLQEKFDKKNLPLKIVETKRRFTIRIKETD